MVRISIFLLKHSQTHIWDFNPCNFKAEVSSCISGPSNKYLLITSGIGKNYDRWPLKISNICNIVLDLLLNTTQPGKETYPHCSYQELWMYRIRGQSKWATGNIVLSKFRDIETTVTWKVQGQPH